MSKKIPMTPMTKFWMCFAFGSTIIFGLAAHVGGSTPEARARQTQQRVTKEAGNTFCTTQRENIKIALHYSVTKLDGRTATIAYPTWIGLSEENRKLLLLALRCTVYGNALSDSDIKIVDLNGVVLGFK